MRRHVVVGNGVWLAKGQNIQPPSTVQGSPPGRGGAAGAEGMGAGVPPPPTTEARDVLRPGSGETFQDRYSTIFGPVNAGALFEASLWP